MNFADEIKARLTAKEIFSGYGFHPNRSGFVCCPFHGEKTASLKVYDDSRGWCCFGCHKGGDVIRFVREFFGLTFQEAIAKINEDFSLGLPIGEKRSDEERLADAKAALERKRRMQKREEDRKRLNDEYWIAFERWRMLDDNMRRYAPQSPDDELHPLFVAAAKNITLALYELDSAEIRRQTHAKRTD